jgi:hypothetical protein
MERDSLFWESLRPYAVGDIQSEVCKTLQETGGKIRETARILGRHHSSIGRSAARIEKNAARRGWSPNFDVKTPCPEGYHLKGTSTLYDADGGVKQQWVKTDKDKTLELELAEEIYTDLASNIKRLPPLKAPKICDKELLNFFVLTDIHLGMYAWAQEGDREWNLDIAERVVTNAFRQMVDQSPKAEKCIIAQLGDFLHWDSMLPVTPAHRHILDSTGRYPEVVGAAIRLIRWVIDDALRHHKEVHAVMATGNHDESGAIWLRALIAALYENEPRFTVDESPKPFYAYQHGKTMLAMHHGHMVKPASIPGVFAATESEMWGQTEYRYAHLGHRHTSRVTESEAGGMHVIEHPTLAARDAYASGHGYFSNSGARAITYHVEYGECGSVNVRPRVK